MKNPIFPVVAALSALGLVGCGEPATTEVSAAAPRAAAGDARRAAELERQIETLERRKERIEDANDIKRLQRAYGYYVDRGMWNEVADLFAEEGSIEIGRDGVYAGRDRVREYLLALGNGRTGLSEGELNEHMQLMPVVTVAPDGTTAKARWRGLVMAGRYGDSAVWGEGPYENEYVKEDGVWKISRLHWFQTFMVPYDGGWAHNVDVNGGKYVSDRLPPDAPPSADYDPWPATWLPPFHFDNPVTGAPEAPAAGDGAGGPAIGELPGAGADELARRAAVLAQEVQLLEDENDIENLQRTYGFYVEEALWSQAADLFAEDGTLEIAGRGVYAGKERVLEYLRSITDEYPRYGLLYDQMQLQPVVHVAPDGRTARARWRLFAQEAEHGEFAEWGVGWYENDYVKEDGVWKIQNLRTFIRMYAPYEDGWGKTALDAPSFSSSLEPDRPSTIEHAPYPAVPTAPFHYENPVTGRPVYEQTAADFASAPAAADLDDVAGTLAALDRRVGLLEDADRIERLHAIYGYYLADYQMDDLGAMFADDGTIEIAQRGVYAGKASVRRNLDLYPPVDLHNHMQYQPVIHVAPDGTTAEMRSRAFSIMGTHEEFATWMGGVYENTFVKDDGVWKIQKDQVFNTYFTPYEIGWKDQPERDPPGITESNPPDLPPSVEFDMYPVPFLPPFHYPNPVTGEPVEVPQQN
ncbi:MAG: nuclear transport factor 2 family protein [Gammaproteobacteria bacterium]|nr:nuclear transport factor 2 family protein [Gammaproteobacteria bacterium]